MSQLYRGLPYFETVPVTDTFADNLFMVHVEGQRVRFTCTVVENPINGEPFLRPTAKVILPYSAAMPAVRLTLATISGNWCDTYIPGVRQLVS